MRPYPVYLLIRGFHAFAGGVAFTLSLVYQIQTVGLGPLQLVLVGTVLEVSCFLAQVPTGVIADLYSRRLSVVVGYLLFGIGFLLQGLVPEFAAILAGNVIWGIGATCIDGAEEAWASAEIGESRVGAAFTRGAQVAQAAGVLGIGTAVLLAGVSLSLPLTAGGVVWLALTGLLALVMPERAFARAQPAERGSLAAVRSQLVAGARTVRTRPVLLCLLGAAFFVGLASEGWDRLQQAHFLSDLTFPSSATPVVWFGAMSVAAMLASIVATQVVHRYVDVLRPARVGWLLLVAQASSAAGVVAFALVGEFWLAVAAFLVVGVLRTVVHPLWATWMVAHSDHRTRATVFSMAGQVDAAGQILGGPPVGLVGERLTIRLALVVTGLLALPAVGLYGRALTLVRRSRTDDTTADGAVSSDQAPGGV
jgi:DHA3 family tetracycline resistance protein-like MFS transporter